MTLHHDLHMARLRIARLEEALGEVVAWADDLRLFSERGTQLAPVFQRAKAVLTQPASSPRPAPDPREASEARPGLKA